MNYHKKGDHQAAFPLFSRAAEQGHQLAQFYTGYYYANGIAIAQSYAMARHWYEKSANACFADDMNNLGSLYENGHGVQKEYALALQWY